MNCVLHVSATIDGFPNDAIFRETGRGMERYAGARGWKVLHAEVDPADPVRGIRDVLRRVRPIGCVVGAGGPLHPRPG
ncbi:MAG: hypothetical protein IJ678_06405, partial [Kiritimatiellae bacterium]|nr:hypothetical protein [Kiritimatiellia bacterium]